MSTPDLKEHATSTHDFYALLGVNFETSESDIRRAYRKTALKYHPDKLGKDFDAEKFHLLQIANDVLSDPAAKAAYDNARNAREQKKKQNELFEGKRKLMKEELEMREGRGSKRGREEEANAEAMLEREMKRLAEDGKRRRREMEERLRRDAEVDVRVSTPQTTAPTTRGTASPKISVTTDEEEDEIAILERKIAEAKSLKAKQRASKKARKSGLFPSSTDQTPQKDSTVSERSKWDTPEDKASSTPIQHSDTFKGLKADNFSASSSLPKFSFSPSTGGKLEGKMDFKATMARLKEAERKRLEDEIRRREGESV